MTNSVLHLQSLGAPGRYVFSARPEFCVGPPGKAFLFGGAGLAAAIEAAGRTCGREVIWATAQYLGYAPMGKTLDVRVSIDAMGGSVTQAGVLLCEGGRQVLRVSAALGERPGQPMWQWEEMPAVPAPDGCVPAELWPRQGAGLLRTQLEIRIPAGATGARTRDRTIEPTGRMQIWMRWHDGRLADAPLLAIFADTIPGCAAMALGRNQGGNSLDNTFRLRGLVAADWVLCDISVAAADRGFAHGDARLFAPDGTLMALASQSLVLREVSRD